MPTASASEPFSLFVATPSLRGSFCKPYVLSIVDLQNHCLRHGIDFELRVAQGISAIDAARNALANWFLFNSKATHLFFWDDDMGAPAEQIARMFHWRDSDVVAAIYSRKSLDMERVKKAVLDFPDIPAEALLSIAGNFKGMFVPVDGKVILGDEPMPVERMGTGLMMISRRCLVRLIDSGDIPWSREEALQGGRLYEFFKSVHTETGAIGEDFYFCDLVRAHGGEVLGCPWVQTSHVGQIEVIGHPKAIARVGGTLL